MPGGSVDARLILARRADGLDFDEVTQALG
jgi:hypothetical protein